MENKRKYYQDLLKVNKDYKLMTINFLQSFLGGGLVCILGQVLFEIYNKLLKIDIENSKLYMTLSIILISGLLTGFGIYDKLGQVFKCGLAIPITGFSNSTISSAIEYHKEGIILGIGANALKLAGSVIVIGITSAIIISSLRYIIEVLL